MTLKQQLFINKFTKVVSKLLEDCGWHSFYIEMFSFLKFFFTSRQKTYECFNTKPKGCIFKTFIEKLKIKNFKSSRKSYFES